MNKRGKRTTNRVFIDIDNERAAVAVSGSGGQTIKGSFGDVRLAIVDDSFAELARRAKYTLDEAIDCILSAECYNNPAP